MISKMKQMFQTAVISMQPYLATDILVPAVISLFAMYLFLVATFSLEHV